MRALACFAVVMLGILLAPYRAASQCSNCGAAGPQGPHVGPYGLRGGPGPGLHDGPGAVVGPAAGYSVQCNTCSQVGPCGPCESCGHWCHYYSEQEKMANDFCRDCCFNWGWQHTPNNALTPRFAPTWRASADALFLLRDGDRRIEFASYGQVTPSRNNIFLTTDSLPECMESGFKTTVSRSLGSCDNLLIEGTYLGTHEWEEHVHFRDPANQGTLGVPGNIFSPFTNFGRPVPIAGLDFNTFVEIGYTSELHSGEINIRHRTGLMCGWLESSMLYGIRYMRINETFFFEQMTGITPLATAHREDIATTNELLGGQLGVLGSYRVSDRWWFELDVKATLAGNDSTQEVIYTRTIAGVPTVFAQQERHNCLSVIGDVDLVSYYQLTRNLSIQLGYQMMWVDGLTLAAEQFNNNLNELILGPVEVNDNGTLVYHGPHLGLTATW